jgi:voltage-gated potassium channel
MIGGIALIGVVTATLASWIVEKVSDAERTEQESTRSELDLLSANVLALTTLLEEARSSRSRKADATRS